MADSDTLRIRRAEPSEAEALAELSLRSKAHWGYDAAFMQLAREHLVMTPELIARAAAYVAIRDGAVAGFYALDMEDGRPTLADLWLEPRFIGLGIGRALWRHMLREAARLGYRTVHITSDPNAAEFYAKMGARPMGAVPSSGIPGRELPLFEADVPA